MTLLPCGSLTDRDSLLASVLTDGGTAGLIWGFVIVTAGFSLVFASIAEIASMYETFLSGLC